MHKTSIINNLSQVTVVVLVATLLALIGGCGSQKKQAQEEAKTHLEQKLALITISPPTGCDPSSKAAKTYVYWHTALHTLDVWRDIPKAGWPHTLKGQWEAMKNHLHNLPTQGVDEDAIVAVHAQAKGITDAMNEQWKAVANAGAASAGQEPGAGVAHGIMGGLAGNAAAAAALDIANAEVARVRALLVARYNLDFPLLVRD